MIDYDGNMDLFEARARVGTLPGGGAPAAWWYSGDVDNISGFTTHKKDEDAWLERFKAFANKHGGDPEYAPTFERFDGSIELRGLRPLDRLVLTPPPGWRFDRKKALLVPSRKTKADREGDIVKEFGALKKIPSHWTYIDGMPPTLWGDRRVYGIDVRLLKGGSVLVAFAGGDPDRIEPGKRNRDFPVSESRWHRLPMSLFHLLREQQEVSA